MHTTEKAGSRHDWVRLNVGGRVFATTRATLTSDPDSMLARMFEPGQPAYLVPSPPPPPPTSSGEGELGRVG